MDKHEQFCYWLKGFIELNGSINYAQWRSIKDHLELTMRNSENMHIVFPEPKKKEVFAFKARLEKLL